MMTPHTRKQKLLDTTTTSTPISRCARAALSAGILAIAIAAAYPATGLGGEPEQEYEGTAEPAAWDAGTASDPDFSPGGDTSDLPDEANNNSMPPRIPSVIQVGVPGERVIQRRGKRHTGPRRVTVLKPTARLKFGSQVQITGRLTNRDGKGIPGVELQVLSRADGSVEQLVGAVPTDSAGNFAYTAAGSASRTLRFAYSGSELVLPAQGEVRLRVPATSTLRPSRTRLTNGQSVAFAGRVPTLPVPAGGKLVELQVLLSGRWQTFRTGRTDEGGRWRLSYRFARTDTPQRFRFRVKLPHEQGYPFATGSSRSAEVQVRGH